MVLDIKAPEDVILKPIITVFGVGGAGGNAVNNMIKANLKGAKFVVANTDAQALKHSESNNKIQLGATSTKGLGAGAMPEVGRESALESENEIRAHLESSNMVFVTAGMGGGTGTGASPVIAKIAKELGILTVGVVTKPFLFEGNKRMKIAESGLKELQQFVDTLIIIPNQNLFRIANEHTTFQQAFEMADEVLNAGVRGVTDLITSPGLVNLDFADIETVMSEKGKAMMGTGEASGEDRAIKAAEAAISNPLLDHSSMCGACGVLINITGGKDMTLYEVDSAANRIREEVGDMDANIIFGSTFNPDLEGVIRVSVVATGIEQENVSVNINSDSSSIYESPYVKQQENNKIETDLNNTNENQEINIDIEEHTPLEFNEYEKEKQIDDQEELKKRLENLTQSMDWKQLDQYQNTNNQQTPQQENKASNTTNNTKSKKSLLSRMWNSLTSSDNNEEVHYISDKKPASNNQKQHVKPEEVPGFFQNKEKERS